MKVNAKQLSYAISRLHSVLNTSSSVNFPIEIEMTQEDPGNGIMVDCMTISATAPPKTDNTEELVHSVTIEIYPSSEGLEPRAVETKTFKVIKSY